ncbi:ABC transporter permease [Cesiribacter andamanensis]|uniref:Dipeptide transport system permease protein dppB n=1 Tax=Cesiribacter andamanensis AMV16 TaxID=1279009 RepID=M7NS42_9BACT|nr:ABC transporter permease [Cesiribacter andamanensis]EMR04520.1 Dipeptide transport system permease protein dppB [Cesiribacter andamanensis AMV16]
MLLFVGRRLGYGFLVLLGVVLVIFFLFHALPGDPVAMMAGQRSDVATREAIQKELGLDKPLGQQLLQYLNDLSPLGVHEQSQEAQQKYEYYALTELGAGEVLALKTPYLRRSFQSNKKVSEILLENVESTFWLAMAAMAFATVVGIAFGVVAALKQNTFADHFIITSSVLGISVPSFVSAIVIAMVFGYYLSDYTGLNITGQLWVNHPFYGRTLHLENLILPALTLGLRPLSIIIQLTRSSMLEVLSQDYIRTARAKGLRYYRVISKHALKNALNPVLTAVSGWLASLMAGAFFVELIFDWKGLGFITIKAVQSLDFPVVMGSTLFIASIFVVVNIFVDVLYAALDPRVRLRS